MTVKTGQTLTVLFNTQNPTSGAVTDADSLPTGTLYVNGTADAATVTVTKISTGRYKAVLTLPTLTAGQVVSLVIAATVVTVNGEGVVFQDLADTTRLSDGVTLANDAITAAKFDESTAFPLKLADAGATMLARNGADADTLETLSDQIDALNNLSVADIIAGIAEGDLDLQEILRIILAGVAGKATGGGTSLIYFRDQADTKDRIVLTVDGEGNRTAVTVDGS